MVEALRTYAWKDCEGGGGAWLYERVRHRAGMTPEQLRVLAAKNSVLVSSVLALPHPQDDFESSRSRWGNVVTLVDELNKMIRTTG